MSYYSEATTEVFNAILGAAQGISDILGSVKSSKTKAGYLNRSSIMKAAKDLVMSFPVLCTDTISPETANMIVKAIERNCVTTLQLLFSAANLKGEDGMQVLQMWHKNMDNDLSMDDYLDAVDAISVGLGESGLEMLDAIAGKFGNEMIAELESASRFIYPESSLSENSLMQFAVRESYTGGYDIYTTEDHCTLTKIHEATAVETLNEAKRSGLDLYNRPVVLRDDDTSIVEVPLSAFDGKSMLDLPASAFISKSSGIAKLYMDQDDWKAYLDANKSTLDAEKTAAEIRNIDSAILDRQAQQQLAQDKLDYQKLTDKEKAKQWEKEFDAAQKQRDIDNAYRTNRDKEKDAFDREKFNYQKGQDALRNADAEVEFFHKQLLPSDVKKANEMVPSMMIVRFNAIDLDSDYPYSQPNYQQFIAGVKARLIAVSSMEAINAVRATEKNKVDLTNLVRATTKEISFCRDFVAGIEQAKIDARANSKLSKTSPIWRSLQWRSSKSVMNRLRRRKANDAGAITTLVLTSEEVNFMKSEYNIDLNIPAKAKAVMEAYNLMCLCIVDEEVEVARFLFDGDKYFQDYSFSALERETGDSNYKKIINLMSKMNR